MSTDRSTECSDGCGHGTLAHGVGGCWLCDCRMCWMEGILTTRAIAQWQSYIRWKIRVRQPAKETR